MARYLAGAVQVLERKWRAARSNCPIVAILAQAPGEPGKRDPLKKKACTRAYERHRGRRFGRHRLTPAKGKEEEGAAL